MFKKILIANRGEIACRIIKTARRMGIATAFIVEEYPQGFQGRPLDAAAKRRFVAASVAEKLACAERARAISGTPGGPQRAAASFVATLDGDEFAVTDAHLHKGRFFARIGGEDYSAMIGWRPGLPVMHLREKDREYAVQIARVAGGYRLSQGGMQTFVSVRYPRAAELAAFMPKKAPQDTSKLLLCPMPGLVVSIHVDAGQEVKAGEPLAVVEAMKMENVLSAERDGTIGKINAKKGDSLALNDVILEFV